MFDVTNQIVKSAKEDPILFPSNKKSNSSKIGDHELAPASYLKTWSLPDKCDYETRKPLQDIDEQILCAGINGDIHEIKFLHQM